MKTYHNSNNDDDRGHILARSLGGPGGSNYYNMAPMYWRLNQQPGRWVDMERMVFDHLRQPNALSAHYNVELVYDDLNTGRPSVWIYRVILSFSDGTLPKYIYDEVPNFDQSGRNQPRPSTTRRPPLSLVQSLVNYSAILFPSVIRQTRLVIINLFCFLFLGVSISHGLLCIRH